MHKPKSIVRPDQINCLFHGSGGSIFSGVGSNCALRGPQIQVVGVILSTEFCDRNIPFLKTIF